MRPSPDPDTGGLDPELAALVVHDLKNRLAGQDAMLAALAAAPSSLPDGLTALRRENALLQRRLLVFLTLYGLQAGRRPAHLSDTQPATLIGLTVRRIMLPQTVAIRLDLAQCPSVWTMDEYLVGLALEAALDNALRVACAEVVLGARVVDDWLVISVEDDGPGPAAPASEARTGLGLGLCHMVAQRHRGPGGTGTTRLRPRSPGPGARFEMRLPA